MQLLVVIGRRRNYCCIAVEEKVVSCALPWLGKLLFGLSLPILWRSGTVEERDWCWPWLGGGTLPDRCQNRQEQRRKQCSARRQANRGETGELLVCHAELEAAVLSKEEEEEAVLAGNETADEWSCCMQELEGAVTMAEMQGCSAGSWRKFLQKMEEKLLLLRRKKKLKLQWLAWTHRRRRCSWNEVLP